MRTAPRPMQIGINLEAVVDWSPAWTFKDLFQASRPWISQTFNSETFAISFDPALAPKLDLDRDGNVRSLRRWTRRGVPFQQFAGTLMFRDTGGPYPAGLYRAEWDGSGVVSFGFDAEVIDSGVGRNGRQFATLKVTPSQDGLYMLIEETDPSDPVRDFNIWMPDYKGQSFVGQRWQPGASFSPFHPLFLERLAPFGTLRFMAMQETNSSDIVTWSQRRDLQAVRQSSGAEGTPSQPLVNGVAVELMVQLANDLDADPWFNMPYRAKDDFVRNFATYVRDNLEPGRKVYVEWANEVWNFGFGFEASHWAKKQARKRGLDPDQGIWMVAGQEAKRDMKIWSEVFSGQENLELVRVAAGWAAVDFVTDRIARSMDGNFDALAIAPYITPTDAQRAGYSASTSVAEVLADTRANIATSLQWVTNHKNLAQQWSRRLGRPIQLLAYEGGDHLDGRQEPYQEAFHAASNHPDMGEIYREYLQGLDQAGLDLYLDFQFTGQDVIAPFGDFGKLHRMDQPLQEAHRYRALLDAVQRSQSPASQSSTGEVQDRAVPLPAASHPSAADQSPTTLRPPLAGAAAPSTTAGLRGLRSEPSATDPPAPAVQRHASDGSRIPIPGFSAAPWVDSLIGPVGPGERGHGAGEGDRSGGRSGKSGLPDVERAVAGANGWDRSSMITASQEAPDSTASLTGLVDEPSATEQDPLMAALPDPHQGCDPALATSTPLLPAVAGQARPEWWLPIGGESEGMTPDGRMDPSAWWSCLGHAVSVAASPA